MLNVNTSNTIKSFLPIFYISKFFGCNLYPLPKILNASNVKANIRAVDLLICLIQLGLAFGISIPLIKKWDDKESPVRKELESIISLYSVTVVSMTGSAANFGYVVIYLIIMFIDMVNASIIRGILLSFADFDEQVKNRGGKINFSYKCMTMGYIAIVLLSQILTIAFGFELLAKEKNGNIKLVFDVIVGNVFADGSFYSFFVTYWLFLENVADRINFINQTLRQHAGKSSHRMGRAITAHEGKTIHVRDLSMMHHIILNIIWKINYCYTLQFVLCLGISFFFSVLNFFVFYKTYSLEVEMLGSPVMMILYTCRSLYFNFFVYKIIEVGSRIKNTKQLTHSLLNKANILCSRATDHIEIKNFSYQLSHSNVEITCGLFPVDWTILYTVASAMGTYLLWFIQFDSIGTKGTVN